MSTGWTAMSRLAEQVKDLMASSEQAVRPAFERIDDIARTNQRRVLQAFWDEKVSEADLKGSTGYGLGDLGRDKLERIYARVFGAEQAIVRPQIISGTHALALGLFGLLKPGDEVLFATGEPYDTLLAVTGLRETVGSLAEWGITSRVAPLASDDTVDVPAVLAMMSARTRLVMFQKSRGYSLRKALTNRQLEQVFAAIRTERPDVVIGVDNCYGEFVETMEPTAIGADVVMGSLIKNPGGGIAPTGGYIAGRAECIERIGARVTAPGVGLEAGPSHDFLRSFYQGLFLAPHVVGQALRGSVLAAYVLEQLGMDVSPRWNEARSDLILSVRFHNADELLAFCRAVQSSAPVDAHVTPVAAPMPGYESPVVMAAGTFIQGGSLEMSADGPVRPPYVGYFQGGLTYEHVYLAVEKIALLLLGLQR